MYKIVFGNRFLKSVEKLDQQFKSKLKNSLDILSENPFTPTLHTKSLSGKLTGFYLFRLGRNYRVIFQFFPDNIINLLNIGDRKDIYR